MSEPEITLRAAHDSGPGNLPPTRYVVHATAGGRGFPRESAAGVAHATALYFQQQSAGGSAHYIHDVAAEEHCVPENVVAWHAPPNARSIGDEICADPSYTRDQWLSAAVWPAVRASAVRCREVCDRYGIPKVKLTPADLVAGRHGICGHVDVSNAFHQTTHWDPGPGFPWDRYMAVVNGEEDDMTPEEHQMLQHIYDSMTPGVAGVKTDGVGYELLKWGAWSVLPADKASSRAEGEVHAAVQQIAAAVKQGSDPQALADAIVAKIGALPAADAQKVAALVVAGLNGAQLHVSTPASA